MLLTLDCLEQKNTTSLRDEAITEAMSGRGRSLGEDSTYVEKQLPLASLAKNFHPYFNQEFRSDNNVDDVKTKRKSSLINVFEPGLRFNLRDNKKTITSEIHLTETIYNNRSDANSGSAEARAALNYNLGKGVITASDTYSNLFEPQNRLTGQQTIDTEDPDYDNTSELLRHWQNVFTLGYGRNFSRFGFDTNYERTDYEEWGGNGNYFEDSFSFNPYFRLTKKSQLLGEYSYSRKIFPDKENPQNYNKNKFGLGVTSALSRKTTVLGKGVYTYYNNKNAEDYKDLTLTGSLGYQMSQRSNLSLRYDYYIRDSHDTGNYYLGNFIELTGSNRMAFNSKLRLVYGASFLDKDYPKLSDPSGGRLDKTYTLKFGCEYILNSSLDFSLTWTHTIYESNVSEDYKKDLISFKTQAKF